jgi:diguanylate cyclase (GGDEF)-like protein
VEADASPVAEPTPSAEEVTPPAESGQDAEAVAARVEAPSSAEAAAKTTPPLPLAENPQPEAASPPEAAAPPGAPSSTEAPPTPEPPALEGPPAPDDDDTVPALVPLPDDPGPDAAAAAPGPGMPDTHAATTPAGGDDLRTPLLATIGRLEAESAVLRDALDAERAARRTAEEEALALADHDALTGLVSPRRFVDRLGVAIVHARRLHQKIAVVQLGLDNFAAHNKRFGRRIGDDLLKSVALALETALRQTDTVARAEGDLFSLLLPSIKRDDDVGVVADKVRLALRNPFSIGGHELQVTASMGVALFPEDGPSPETLLENARTAMVRAKRRGGDTWMIHAPHSSALAQERQARESALRRALVQGELELYYQPMIDCAGGGIVGLEALLRWRDPSRMLTASEFVPLAEVTGLAVPLGQWALRHACTQVRAWHDAGHEGLLVSVNISARQLQHPSLVKLVRRVLDETRLPAACLELEVSEPEVARNTEASLERFVELKEMGVRLALDDFGTGDTVLRHLARYPIDTLKIDASVVRDIATDRNAEALVQAGIAVARARRLKVVAEGVETEAQRVLLTRWQCDCMQGNLCGAPASPGETEGLLIRQRKTARALAAPEG